jgi:SAM-dependent methyltransferase
MLPFPDGAFDVVLCQFGVMFFPDKPRAFAEALRVLKPGGRFLFSIWDRIEANEFADAVVRSVAALYPQDPPMFLARTPHGHHDTAVLEAQLRTAGFARRASKPSRGRARRRARFRWPSDTARALRCGTKSRSTARRPWPRRPRSRPTRSLCDTGPGQSPAGSGPT